MKKVLDHLQVTDKPERVVFHYNKKHNEDQSVPPWVVKCKGQTFYVMHMEISPGVGFTTKETPDSPHTKAALQIKGKLSILTMEDYSQEARVE